VKVPRAFPSASIVLLPGTRRCRRCLDPANPKREVEELGGKALALPLDVADADQVELAAAQVEEKLGPIDAWINNAMVLVFSTVPEMTARETDGHGGAPAPKSYHFCGLLALVSAVSKNRSPLDRLNCKQPAVKYPRQSRGNSLSGLDGGWFAHREI
jgi:hypothetical protein